MVRDALAAAHEGLEVELVEIKTSGDEGQPGAAGDDKARFVKEIEQALLEERIDLGVHSAKDVPGELPAGLAIVAVPGAGRCPGLAVRRDGDRRSGRGRAGWHHQPAAPRPAARAAPRPGGDGPARQRRHPPAAAGRGRPRRAGAGGGGPRAARPRRRGLADPAGADDPGARPGLPGARGARRRRALDRTLASALTDPDALAALTAERALVSALGATCNTPVGRPGADRRRSADHRRFRRAARRQHLDPGPAGRLGGRRGRPGPPGSGAPAGGGRGRDPGRGRAAGRGSIGFR